LPQSSQGKFCVNPDALRMLNLQAKSNVGLQEKIRNATTPVPLRPALTRPLVDAWSMTSLKEHAGRPDIAPWLRGWIDGDLPQTSVVWRTYLPVRLDGGVVSNKEIEDFFDAADPHESERLETETYRIVDWLIERLSKATFDDKNRMIAFALTPSGDICESYRVSNFSIQNDDKKKGKYKENLNRELAGKTLIVDARLKGLANGLLDPDSDDDVDTADGGKWLEINGHPIVGFRVYEDGAVSEVERKKVREVYAFARRRSEDGDDKDELIIETRDTEESRATSITPQILEEHHSWTKECVLAIAGKIGLTGEHKRCLAIAARLHDEGKRSLRWQRAFSAKPERVGECFAKTRGPIRYALLDGYRHEFGSLPYVEEDTEFKTLPSDLQDLVLHIVAAHHGRARPSIETMGCEDKPPSVLQERACDVALRFTRLQKQWGPWGLAWWESLLRAADQQASRKNDEPRASNG
jgi:CRISPR-associated endonuclease/helicase Cas3